MGTAIRVLAAGMLAGVMMESGAAESIANAIVQKLGEKKLFYLWHYTARIQCSVFIASVGKVRVSVSYHY